MLPLFINLFVSGNTEIDVSVQRVSWKSSLFQNHINCCWLGPNSSRKRQKITIKWLWGETIGGLWAQGAAVGLCCTTGLKLFWSHFFSLLLNLLVLQKYCCTIGFKNGIIPLFQCFQANTNEENVISFHVKSLPCLNLFRNKFIYCTPGYTLKSIQLTRPVSSCGLRTSIPILWCPCPVKLTF